MTVKSATPWTHYANQIPHAGKTGDLLQKEALLTKQLYRYAAKSTKLGDFVREREATDLANGFLNHGNYLAYGLAATTLWVLGIPHGFAVMHGKTRRGALVFDVADLIKDAIVLPWAFISAKEKATEQEFRQQILQKFTEHKALDFMFEQVKQQALREDWSMMVTFVSQCEKKALNRTRRVLDAFANRIGDNTWQTVITEDGLIAVKTLLRKTATKNTAVACHWLRSRSRSELVWIVGNRKRFNAEGIVPVNSTRHDFSHREWEKGWHTTEIIAIASAISGLFHNLGKANNLFQDKLNPEIKGKRFEPYRHEWVSLRLFQANTDNQHQLKQKLDEHNVGVSQHAFDFILRFRRLREELPPLADNKTLVKGPKEDKEPWQTKAYQASQQIQSQVKEQGFFGINMASTGKGKTLANARIMYGLADESEGCRFSVALGLRTLTLQTGEALQERLELDKTEIATLIGSQAILRLNQINRGKQTDDDVFAMRGSESLDMGLDDDGFDVIYGTELYEGQLEKWFKNNPKDKKLLHAPILVSTIDHLTPATEGVRGGRQIVPMLRLLTSDLVLDELDEFDLNDLPALTRLVNWAGMLGANVLVSTATMPPALAYALFEAYQEGRKAFNAATVQANAKKPVVCAWFDEFSVQTLEQENIQSFIKAYDEFIQKRIAKLSKDKLIFRKAKLLKIAATTDLLPLSTMNEVIRQSILTLHQDHHQLSASGKKISIGLVRIANINSLVAIARLMYANPAPENFRIHYCVYHSQYPLAHRAFIESKLDQALNRKDQEAIWNCPEQP